MYHCPQCLRSYREGSICFTCDCDLVADSPPAGGSVGNHPWADSTGKITPKSAGVAVSNLILNAGAKASTAFRCALLISEDIENHPERYKLKAH